uniref:Chromosome 22 open reading frame 23 n=1 Tax=Eptatretus burgeri TaxID=7764 RepID=A0A8C4PXC4_EPTBU
MEPVCGSLPVPNMTPSAVQHHSMPTSLIPIKPGARPHLRPAEVCRASDAYTCEPFLSKCYVNGQDEKDKLQNIMANCKSQQSPPCPINTPESPTVPDRFQELIGEIDERVEFLQQIRAFGKEKEYKSIIYSQISEKMHEMEAIDKERTKEMRCQIFTGKEMKLSFH